MSSFRFMAIEGKVQRFPYVFCPQACIASPIVNTPHQSGIFVIIYETTLTHYYYPKTIVHIMVQLGVVNAMGLYKCIMTCFPDYSIIQGSVTALKILYAPSIHPSPPS